MASGIVFGFCLSDMPIETKARSSCPACRISVVDGLEWSGLKPQLRALLDTEARRTAAQPVARDPPSCDDASRPVTTASMRISVHQRPRAAIPDEGATSPVDPTDPSPRPSRTVGFTALQRSIPWIRQATTSPVRLQVLPMVTLLPHPTTTTSLSTLLFRGEPTISEVPPHAREPPLPVIAPTRPHRHAGRHRGRASASIPPLARLSRDAPRRSQRRVMTPHTARPIRRNIPAEPAALPSRTTKHHEHRHLPQSVRGRDVRPPLPCRP